jgi:hypothetical protein
LSVRPSADDPYGEDIAIGAIGAGTTHDGCFFSLAPASQELKRSLLDAVLGLHAHYLGSSVRWERVGRPLFDRWEPGLAMRFRSSPSRQTFVVRRYDAGAGLLARRVAPAITIERASGVAVMRERRPAGR